MSKNYILVHNTKKDTYSIYNAGNKLRHAAKAKVPDSDGEYYTGSILFRGTEINCENYAKRKFENNETYFEATDIELPLFEQNEDTQRIKKSK